ncbi:MAG: hypothetical protein RQ731_08105 [Anaerosomatales bacterium]|nr:hypothetical protein [Anaerosomatales bacterium]
MLAGVRRGEIVLERFNELEAAYVDRNTVIEQNRRFSLADMWEPGEIEALGEGVEPMTVPYAHAILMKNVTFLMGRAFDVQVEVASEAEPARRFADYQEKVAYGIMEFNQMSRRALDMAWNCGVCGGQPMLVDWDVRRRLPRWLTPQPENFFPVPYTDGRYGFESYIVRDYYLPETATRLFPKAGRLPDEWETDHTEGGLEYVTVLRYSDAAEHVRVLKSDGSVLDTRIGYGWTNAAYVPNIPVPGAIDGLAEMTLLRPLNRKLNELLTFQNDVVMLRSDPPVVVEDPMGKIDEMDFGSGMRIPVNKGGRVYYLEWAGTPPDFASEVQQVFAAMQDVGGVPDVAFGRYEASIQSGIALNTQFQPVRLLMAVKQQAWQTFMQDIFAMSFDLMGQKLGSRPTDVYYNTPKGEGGDGMFGLLAQAEDMKMPVRVKLIWPGMLPKDDATEAQTLLNRLQSGGISLHTYLEQMGATSAIDEIARIKEEREDPLLHPELAEQTGEMSQGGMEQQAAGAANPFAEMGEMGMTPQSAFGGMDMGLGGGGMGMPAGMGMDAASVSPEEAYANRPAGGMEGMI